MKLNLDPLIKIISHRSLKTGGVEVLREKWHEAKVVPGEDNMDTSVDYQEIVPQNLLPDWTRSPLPVGAPSAVPRPILPATPANAV